MRIELRVAPFVGCRLTSLALLFFGCSPGTGIDPAGAGGSGGSATGSGASGGSSGNAGSGTVPVPVGPDSGVPTDGGSCTPVNCTPVGGQYCGEIGDGCEGMLSCG